MKPLQMIPLSHPLWGTPTHSEIHTFRSYWRPHRSVHYQKLNYMTPKRSDSRFGFLENIYIKFAPFGQQTLWRFLTEQKNFHSSKRRPVHPSVHPGLQPLSRAEDIADHYWPQPVFFLYSDQNTLKFMFKVTKLEWVQTNEKFQKGLVGPWLWLG